MNCTITLEIRATSESLEDVRTAIVNALALTPTVGEVLDFQISDTRSLDRDPDFHDKDSDCSVGEDGTCSVCGADHGEPCPDCHGRAFHNPGCSEVA